MVLGIKMRTDGYEWVRKTFLTVTVYCPYTTGILSYISPSGEIRQDFAEEIKKKKITKF